MNYEIIATLGPASASPAAWQAMLDAGATAFRLNTSHLSLDQLKDWLERLASFLELNSWNFELVLDLQGSKWRLGSFTPFTLQAGQTVVLIQAPTAGQPGTLPVPHPDFFKAALLFNGEVLLNDAKSRLRVESTLPEAITASVEAGGTISPNKGITFADSSFRSEALSEKDQAILRETGAFDKIRYAISYVRDAAEMARYRALAGPIPRLIAKLERGPAIKDAAAIAAICDTLWVCRGDLGAELGFPGMAEAVAQISRRVRDLPASVLLAGQVLEHMTGQPAPTRSEVCCLHDALAAGYRGVVLSDETAIGRYPVESCRAAAMFQRR